MKITQYILACLIPLLLSFEGFCQAKAKPKTTSTKEATAKIQPSKARSPIASDKKVERPLSALLWLYKDSSWIKYQGHARTLGQLYKELGISGRVYDNAPNCDKKGKEKECLTLIGYKLFTDEPLFALVEDTTNIKSLVNQFNIEEFMSSWEFEFYLKGRVETGSLYDVFLLETLGTPDKKTSYASTKGSFETWGYNNYNLSITLKNGIATSFIKSD